MSVGAIPGMNGAAGGYPSMAGGAGGYGGGMDPAAMDAYKVDMQMYQLDSMYGGLFQTGMSMSSTAQQLHQQSIMSKMGYQSSPLAPLASLGVNLGPQVNQMMGGAGGMGGSPYSQMGGSPYGQMGGSPYGQMGGSPYSQMGGSPYGQSGQSSSMISMMNQLQSMAAQLSPDSPQGASIHARLASLQAMMGQSGSGYRA